MYLREALTWCRDLEDEAGHIYEELAAQHAHDGDLRQHWSGLAADERLHARIMAALLAAEDVQEDDGPFVVDVRPRLERLRKILNRAYQQVREGIAPPAAAELAVFIEGSELNDVFGELIELARPSVLRLLSIVEVGIDEGDQHREHLEALLRTVSAEGGAGGQRQTRQC